MEVGIENDAESDAEKGVENDAENEAWPASFNG